MCVGRSIKNGLSKEEETSNINIGFFPAKASGG